VADEVPKLAERTSVATKEITQMIAGVQEGTRLAVSAVQAATREVSTVYGVWIARCGTGWFEALVSRQAQLTDA
jgi:methyl-accepting chemotaxis protein